MHVPENPTEVVILCGGRGTRAYPDTLELPKPLLPVGGLPIVEHVMRIFARQGHRRFILATGYLGDMIEQRYSSQSPDGHPLEGCEIVVVDTGDETETGERVRLAAQHVEGDRFFATYADGVGDVDVNELLAEHRASGALATVTTVPLPSQYGVLESTDDGRITRFREKPRLQEHWINGGFFVFEKTALAHWEGEVLEQDVLPALAQVGGLYAYRHVGFWKSMDTYKDRQELDSLARGATPPWHATEISLPLLETAMAASSAAATEAAGESRSALALVGEGPGSDPRPPALQQYGTPSAAAEGAAPAPTGRRATIDMLTGPPGTDLVTGKRANGTGNGKGAHDSDRGGTAQGNGTGNGGVTDTVTLPAHGVVNDVAPPPAFRPPPRRAAGRRLSVVTFLTMVVDFIAVVATYGFVGSIEGGSLGARLVGGDRPELLLTVPVWIACMAVYGLYDRPRLVAGSEEARRLFHAVAIGAVAMVLVTFAWNNDVGRSYVAVLALAIVATVGAGRVLARAVVQLLAARGIIGTRVLVIGTNHEAHAIARTLDRKRWLGYAPVGLIETRNGHTDDTTGFPVVGHVKDVVDAVRETDAGAVIVAATAMEPDCLNKLCDTLQTLRVDVRVSAGLPQISASRVSVEPLDGLAVLSVKPGNRLSRGQTISKRAVDIVVSSLLLLLALPLIGALAILVRATSKGPALFRQVRVGAGGKPFVLYKLRTMSADAEDRVVDLRDKNTAEGLLFKIDNDPRVTRIGRSLRRWGLDELPQLFNVLRGDMSLVGPRPPLPSEARRYDEWVRGRLDVKPGITGLWQVNGGHTLRFDDYVRFDLFYVENWSVALDFYILVRTIPALLFRRGLS